MRKEPVLCRVVVDQNVAEDSGRQKSVKCKGENVQTGWTGCVRGGVGKNCVSFLFNKGTSNWLALEERLGVRRRCDQWPLGADVMMRRLHRSGRGRVPRPVTR